MSCLNLFFKIIIILSFFSVFTNTASAIDLNISNFSISNVLADAFAPGFDNILTSITDQMYDNIGLNSTETNTIIANFMVQPNDFLSNEFVQKEKTFTAFWYAVFYVIFLLVGGIMLMKEEATPKHGFGISGPAWRNTYISIALIAPLVWAFYLYSFKWIFSLEYVLSKSTFLEIMDFMPPTTNNALGYAILGIMRLFNILFMYIRYMVIGLIAGWFLFVIIARFIPITAIYGKIILNYGLLMLFSRFVIVLIFLGGFGILQDISFLPNSALFAPYFIVLLLALLFELAVILYPVIYVFAHSPVKYVKIR